MSPHKRPLGVAGRIALVSFAAFLPSFGWAKDPSPEPAPADLALYYFKTPRFLSIDPTQVAIFSEGSRGDAVLADAAAAVLGDDIRLEASVSAGWTLVHREAGFGGRDAILNKVATLSGAGDLFATPVLIDDRGEPVYPTPWLHVQFARPMDAAVVRSIVEANGATPAAIESLGGMENAYRIRTDLRDGAEVLRLAGRLAVRDDVRFAEPDLVMVAWNEVIPNDPRFNECWGLNNTGQFLGSTVDADMDAPEAWDTTFGNPSVIVLIFDSGVQQNHPDLNLVAGTDTTGGGTGGNPGNACDNHGTNVAGCVSAIANNGIGVTGVAPGVKSASVRMCIANLACDGSLTYQSSWHVSGLQWGQGIGARVSNASFSVFSSSAVSNMYTTTRNAGMVHFASAGNGGSNQLAYPASLNTVLSVSALSPNGSLAGFSNYGQGLDMAAPGDGVLTTDRTGPDGYVVGDYAYNSGTSFASPYAAGVAALVLSVNPSLSASDVESWVSLTCIDIGTPGYDTIYGWGHVNARNAINFISTPPGAFSLVAPASGVTEQSRLPVLSWAESPGRVTFTITLDTTPGLNSPNRRVVSNISETSLALTPPLLAQNTLYYWGVTAVNAFGNRISTPATRTFTTIVDCDNNNIADAQQIAANPALDCNGNGALDSCDLSSGASPDCNQNNRPDECDIADCVGDPLCADCNNNGRPDSCDFASGISVDCNANSVPDECDRASCAGQPFCSDCNNNNIIDYCDIVQQHEIVSPTFMPLGTPTVHTANFVNPPQAFGQVSIRFEAKGDLNTGSEFVTIAINGVNYGNLWTIGGIDCVEVTSTITLSAAEFNTAKFNGGGTVAIQMTPSPAVAPAPPACSNDTYIRVRLEYAGQGSSLDENGDGVPDECAVPGVCAGDMDCGGTVDFADIDRFVEALGYPGGAGWPYPACPWLAGDANDDGDVSFADIDAFVALIGTTCP